MKAKKHEKTTTPLEPFHMKNKNTSNLTVTRK